ncbi:MAG TPA: Nramp family divalent metal transporter [Blastocatellia bacterium]|nr:Nramp family divalent metal transporter [Blastocatellia bacterium]
MMLGPGFVWMGEAIGSGEVILSTRFGAVMGAAALWAPALAIFLKYWIGMAGARYTVCTGEGMMDMFSRLPGPRNWAVWIVLLAQTLAAMISTGGLAVAAGVFAHALLPALPGFAWSWILAALAVIIVWSGRFDALKRAMTLLVTVMIIGVGYVTIKASPDLVAALKGLFAFTLPAIPDWALATGKIDANPWREVGPIMGWAAGGVASQVWYTYWVLGAGYGMTHGRSYGQPCDVQALKHMSSETALKVRGWCRVVYADATMAMVIGMAATLAFMLAGATILAPRRVVPEGPSVAFELAAIFGAEWGRAGEILFILAGWAALFSTLIGQLAGWPRLLSDGYRICVPRFGRIAWEKQFRLFLIGLLAINFLITYALGLQPVRLIQTAAFTEGVLLVPLQAVAILLAIYLVQPRLLSEDAARILRPGALFGALLVAGAIIYSLFIVARFTL